MDAREKVAEALKAADAVNPADNEADHYSYLADAAIQALGLTEEWTAGMEDWCGDEGGFDLDPDIYDNHEGAERAVQHCQEHGWEGDKSFVVSRLVGPWEKRP